MLQERIKAYRKSNKLTQQQVSDALNIKRSTYAYYEIGKNRPGIKIISKLARLYNVSIDTFVAGTVAAPALTSAQPLMNDGTSTYNRDFDPKDDEDAFAISENEVFVSKLTEDEQNILLLYRLIDDKGAAKQILTEMSQEDEN